MFNIVMYIGMGMFAVALLATLALMLKKGDRSRAVVSDLVFFCMVGMYVIWTLITDTSIVYEVALLAALLGLITTVSNARILSQGRR